MILNGAVPAGGRLLSALLAIWGLSLLAQPPTEPNAEGKRLQQAKGSFELQVVQRDAEKQEPDLFPRIYLEKQFHGDLQGTSRVEMLSFRTLSKTSGGYVALEQVEGTLQGKTGSFVLQHSGTMINGVPQMQVIVVPESGTGQFKGIDGAMTIRIKDGKHYYDFEYALP
jgi:hypothetical protein